MNKTSVLIDLLYVDKPVKRVNATAVGPVLSHYPPERILWFESDIPTYQQDVLCNYFLTSYAQFVIVDRSHFHSSLYDTAVKPIEKPKEDVKNNRLAHEEAISAYTELKIIEERVAKLEKSLSQILNHLTP